ncbi:MAG: STAS domain-containing protein [Thermoleophilaceae bacterium]
MTSCTGDRRRRQRASAGGPRAGRLALRQTRCGRRELRAVHHAFDIRGESAGDVQIVWVKGDVDLDTAQRFSEGIRRATTGGDGAVLVDLCEVPFMDSTGLHLLLNLLRRLTRQRREMAVACSPSGVQRLFELTRLDGTFQLYESRAEALAGLEHSGRLGV